MNADLMYLYLYFHLYFVSYRICLIYVHFLDNYEFISHPHKYNDLPWNMTSASHHLKCIQIGFVLLTMFFWLLRNKNVSICPFWVNIQTTF